MWLEGLCVRCADERADRAPTESVEASPAVEKFEPGQRVDVLTYDDRVIPGVHTVVDGDRFGLDPARFIRVRRMLGGERTYSTEPIDRVRRRR